MFPGDSETNLEGGHLRSGRRFWSGKRRRNVTRRGSCSMTRGEVYELTSHFEGGSCDEEDEYQPISKREEEEEEAPNPEYEYGTPTTLHTSLKVRSRNSSHSGFSNISNNNCGNSGQGSPFSQTSYPIVPRTNIMAGNDIKLPIFNGNGLEYPKQHWFLCEAM